MKRKTLSWIIGLMGLTMIGLITLQLYWIDSLVAANEERFKKDVLDALNIVASKLEKQETYVALQKLNYLNEQVYREDQASFLQKIQEAQLDSDREMKVTQGKDPQAFHFADTISDGTFEFTVNFSGITSFFSEESLPPPRFSKEEILTKKDVKIQELESTLAKVSRKYELTFDVVNDWMNPNRPISSRFSKKQLDSLLKNELVNKGITIDFEYGVVPPNQQHFLTPKQKRLKSRGLSAALFPNDIYGNNSMLIVDFPEKKGYFLRKMWSAMVSSGFLMLVILFCFGYSIRTILRQKKLSEMKTDFINNMTHELKTPISNVSMAVDMLNDKDIAKKISRAKYIGIIGEENKRLGDHVEKVLQIAATDRQIDNLRQETLKMNDLVKSAADHIFMQVKQRGARLNIIEKADEDLVQGDEMHLTNIIINLLDNANKYSPEIPNITVRTSSDADEFIISIHDKGVGMSREQQKHIFEKFYRVPTGNVHNVKGFGLGLAYVQQIVEAHRGSVCVDSELGKGSKFSIILPLVHEA